MTTAATRLTRRDLETRLIEKAWKDPGFRENIIRDPKSMLESHTGQKLPQQFKIYVHQEDANTLHFSIPPAPSNVTELSDQDLEKVAGGTDLIAVTAVVATAVATVAATAGANQAGVFGKPW